MLPWQPGGIKFTPCVSDQKAAYALDRKMIDTF